MQMSATKSQSLSSLSRVRQSSASLWSAVGNEQFDEANGVSSFVTLSCLCRARRSHELLSPSFFLLSHFPGQSAKFLSWFSLGFQVNAGLPGWIS